jgi:diguanylate cyclase (GGDEF)-like protein/PAS domain S-box-containing protein
LAISSDLKIPQDILSQWQTSVDLLTDISGVSAIVITHLQSGHVETLISSQKCNNPYYLGKEKNIATNLHHQTLNHTEGKLHLSTATIQQDQHVIQESYCGMNSYFGLPLSSSLDINFGTVCLLDEKQNNFQLTHRKLLSQLQQLIEKDLHGLSQQHELASVKKQLTKETQSRKKAQQKLKDNEFFFKESQRAAFIGSYRSDFVLDRWETSEICDQIFGMESNYNKTVQGWSALVHPEDFDNMVGYVNEEVIGKNLPFNKEYRIIRRTDGETRWVLGLGETISDSSGGCIGLIGTIQDITERKKVELALDSERCLLSTLLDTLPDLIWLKDTKGNYLRCNYRFEQFYGASRDYIIGKCDHDFVSKELADSFIAHDNIAIQTNKPFTHEAQASFAADNHQELLETTKVPMRNVKGDLIGVLGIGHDITEKKRANDQLKLAASVFTHAREGILITDAGGNIIKVNDTFTTITGYSREEVFAKNPRFLQSGRQTDNFYKSMWSSLLQNKYWSGELWNRRKNGEVFAEIVTISAITDSDDNVQNYVALFTDITSIKEHQQQLEHIAHYDALTGLPNRVLLAERLQQAMLRCDLNNNQLAVAYLDIDRFKDINDTYGHSAGDEFLVILAQRIKNTIRKGDILARIGGDEFVVALVDLDSAIDCDRVLLDLLTISTSPIKVKDSILQTSASIGVTVYPEDGVDADLLMRHADQAMYIAKQNGKDQYHMFDVGGDSKIKTQRETLDRIYLAIEQKEFVLYYQPKVNMKTGRVIGLEALIRWQHPERGLLSPASFLPITEKQPVEIEIGEWVINTALSQIDQWQAIGLDIPVSVNISAQQLQEKSFATKLKASLAHYPNLAPHLLELEILETSALEDMAEVSINMQACQKMGINFSLDDFGTGYSSLTYLKLLPTHQLKIDQSFIKGMLDDEDDKAIVKGIIGLATAFQRQVIAEGVETIAIGNHLLAMGCEFAQGYGIAMPMPAADIDSWITQWKPDSSWAE